MKTLDEEKLRREFDEMELKHWSSRLSEFVNVPLSCKKQVADYWIEKMKQEKLAMLEDIRREISQLIIEIGDYTLYKERLNK